MRHQDQTLPIDLIPFFGLKNHNTDAWFPSGPEDVTCWTGQSGFTPERKFFFSSIHKLCLNEGITQWNLEWNLGVSHENPSGNNGSSQFLIL